ncbi:MAG: response regulator [Campylobacterota bacterium]
MVNIVYLDDEIFNIGVGTKQDAIDLLESDLDDISDKFELFVFDSMDEALNKIKELGNNTILILDMQMGDKNGADFLSDLRTENITIPVIAFTGNDNEERYMQLMENDIFSYVKKAEKDYSKLKMYINRAIEKFKDNIPLELTEALHEFLEKRPERKEKVIMTKEGRTLTLKDIENEINKKSPIGIDYQKALYKMSFERLQRQEEKL